MLRPKNARSPLRSMLMFPCTTPTRSTGAAARTARTAVSRQAPNPTSATTVTIGSTTPATASRARAAATTSRARACGSAASTRARADVTVGGGVVSRRRAARRVTIARPVVAIAAFTHTIANPRSAASPASSSPAPQSMVTGV